MLDILPDGMIFKSDVLGSGVAEASWSKKIRPPANIPMDTMKMVCHAPFSMWNPFGAKFCHTSIKFSFENGLLVLVLLWGCGKICQFEIMGIGSPLDPKDICCHQDTPGCWPL